MPGNAKSVKLRRCHTWVRTGRREVAAVQYLLLLLTIMMMRMMIVTVVMRWRNERDRCSRRAVQPLSTNRRSRPRHVSPSPAPPERPRASRRPRRPGIATAASATVQWRRKTARRLHRARRAPATMSWMNSAPVRPTETSHSVTEIDSTLSNVIKKSLTLYRMVMPIGTPFLKEKK